MNRPIVSVKTGRFHRIARLIVRGRRRQNNQTARRIVRRNARGHLIQIGVGVVGASVHLGDRIARGKRRQVDAVAEHDIDGLAVNLDGPRRFQVGEAP